MSVPLIPPIDSGFQHFDLSELAHGIVERPQPALFDLFYPGRVHSVTGEPGLGKSWFAWRAVTEVIGGDEKAAYLDFEDDVVTALTRLAALGVAPSDTSKLTYLRPFTAPDTADWLWLAALIKEYRIRLVVIDSVPEALALSDFDENSAMDTSRWFQSVPRPLAHAGATVVCVDHVTKATEGRGRWARGSGAKLAAIDGAAFTLEPVEPFSRDRSGSSTQRVAKDRHGSVGGAGQPVRTVRFDVAGGSLHSIRLERYLEPMEAPTAPDRLEPYEVRSTLEAAGGVWLSHSEAAYALGVSTNAVGRILADAVMVGAIDVEHHGSRRTYRLPAETDVEASR